jgi:hypothetical protein
VRAAVIVAGLAALAVLRFAGAVGGWFMYDDPHAMMASTAPLGEIFFSRVYSSAFYTPLVALSFMPDVHLFGLNPGPYHVHNAILVVAISGVTYHIARRFAPDTLSALAAALIVLLSPAALVCVLWITLRQYLYAMLAALVAVLLHLGRIDASRVGALRTAGALVACELSFLGKEQFLTLPAVLVLITPGDLRRRLRLTYPYLVLLLAHGLLRHVVLGGAGGPWFVEYRPVDLLITSLAALPTTAAVLFGSPLALLVVALPWLRRWRDLLLAWGVWVVSLAVAFAGMGWVPQTDDHRYWLQATVLMAFGVALGARGIRSPLVRAGYVGILLAALLLHSATASRPLRAHFEREADLAARISEALLRPDLAGAIILTPPTPYIHSLYLASMAALYERTGRTGQSPAVYPAELLALEPRLAEGARAIYRVAPGGLHRIPDSERSALVTPPRFAPGAARPRVALGPGPRLRGELTCSGPASGVALFTFRGPRLHFADRMVIPHRPTYPLDLLVGSNARAAVVPLEDVLLNGARFAADAGGNWTGAVAYAAACRDGEGRSTPLSDAVLVQRSGEAGTARQR